MNKATLIANLLIAALPAMSCAGSADGRQKETESMYKYTIVSEDAPHDGTWLAWPHRHTYGTAYRDSIEPVWVAMAAALSGGERVHIIAYDETEHRRIARKLEGSGADMAAIDFVAMPTDDVWIRDTGPVFVCDSSGRQAVVDFAFDGWGRKAPHSLDDAVPRRVAAIKGLPLCDASDVVIEGGAVETDGAGTLMACESSVVSPGRNRVLAKEYVERRLRQCLGVSNFIWLKGAIGEDITDAHIDGIARFYDSHTIIAVARNDFADLYEGIDMADAGLWRCQRQRGRAHAHRAISRPEGGAHRRHQAIQAWRHAALRHAAAARRTAMTRRTALRARPPRRRSGGLVSALGRGAGPWRPQRHVRQPLRHRGVGALAHGGLLG